VEYSFGHEIDTYINQIKSLNYYFQSIMSMIEKDRDKNLRILDSLIKEKGVKKIDKTKKVTKIIFNVEMFSKYISLRNKFITSREAYKIIPRSLFVSLVSQFDAYLGNLIRIMFKIKPELLNLSEKNISYSELIEYSSIDDIKDYIISKEIDSILRDGHIDQFDWLEKRLGIKLRKDLKAWSIFVEATERRNLFVHCDGKVTKQYLNVCRNHRVERSVEFDIGKTLSVDEKYFTQAYKCLFEIGVKLGHVIWRKIQEEDREEADKNLNNISYYLINDEDYELSIILLIFATDILKKYSSEESKHVFIVNKAQAYKWNGNNEECRKIIEGVDWSAADLKFKLAKFVLLDDFKSALEIMKKIGKDGDIKKVDYKEWPLFKEFRKSEKFLKMFEEIFGEKFEISEEEEEKLKELVKQ